MKTPSLFLILFLGVNALGAQTFILQPDGSKGKDTEIWSSAAPTAVLGNRESMNVYTWTYSGILSLKRMLIEFDLPSLPASYELTDARLSIFFNPSDPYESREFHYGENKIFIERISSPWEELEVNWNNQPETTVENRLALPASDTPDQDYLDIDVTALVRDMIEDPENSFGFMFKMQNELTPYRMLLMASSDHPDAAYHPKLVLTYNNTTANAQNDVPELDFTISPNPVDNGAGSIVTVHFPGFKPGVYRYAVTDIAGKKIIDTSVVSANQNIDVSNLASATYLLILSDSAGNRSVKKFIVAKN